MFCTWRFQDIKAVVRQDKSLKHVFLDKKRLLPSADPLWLDFVCVLHTLKCSLYALSYKNNQMQECEVINIKVFLCDFVDPIHNKKGRQIVRNTWYDEIQFSTNHSPNNEQEASTKTEQ